MSKTASRRLNPGRLQVAYDLLQESVANGDLPVAVLAVANGRETVRCEGYGPRGPIATDGIYLLASITKPIVATAVMQLVERGKLLVDDPVVRYIPEFGVNGKQAVRIWHLLTHTSGLDEGYLVGPHTPGAPLHRPTPEDDLRAALATYLRFPPGSRYEYCNASFRILGELITRLGGAPYPEYLRQSVFAPAGMPDTAFIPDPAQRERVLPVHDFPNMLGGLETFVSMALPAGGLHSTAADLVAFGQAFLNDGEGKHGRLLSPASIATMTRLQTQGILEYVDGVPSPAHYGLGWGKVLPQQGTLLSPAGYGHGGATGTHLWIDPDLDLVIVFLTNRWGSDGRSQAAVMNAVMASFE